MRGEKLQTFHIDGDRLTVPYRYDEGARIYIGLFPEFEEEPRYTPNGRPWKSVVSIGCPHAAGEYDDCGSCPHLMKAGPQDIIGVCFHEKLRSRAQIRAPESAETGKGQE